MAIRIEPIDITISKTKPKFSITTAPQAKEVKNANDIEITIDSRSQSLPAKPL